MSQQAREALLAKRQKPILSEEGAISTGSTLLNLACTDNPSYGFLKGHYYYLVGDSTSGKTWTSLTCFAEAARNRHFDDYEFVFDDVEGGALMDIGYYFGKAVARRIRPPAMRKGEPINSSTIEEFYINIERVIQAGKPFIYVLDSQDALDSKAAAKKFKELKKANEEGEEAKGSYGDGKAKYHNERLRHVLSELRRMRSILIIVGHTKDNLGFGFEKKRTSGGKSLRYYATLEIWTSLGHKLRKRVRGAPRVVGIECVARVRKNRVTGKDREVVIPIYYAIGIDDVGSCVSYLIDEKQWRKVKSKDEDNEEDEDGGNKKTLYDAKELLIQGTRESLIRQIEEDGLEDKLRTLTGKLWKEIEEESRPNRKLRYE